MPSRLIRVYDLMSNSIPAKCKVNWVDVQGDYGLWRAYFKTLNILEDFENASQYFFHFSCKQYMGLKSYSQVLMCNPELV